MISQTTKRSRGLHGFAVFTASVAYLVVITGAIITSDRGASASGDFNLSRLLEWVKADDGHRLAAYLVAALTLALGAALLMKDNRRWMKWLGGIAVLAVVIQSGLGHLEARHLEFALAVSHSCMAQAYFCLMVSLAIFTHPRWQWGNATGLDNGKPAVQQVSLWFSIIVFAQIVLGAIYRDDPPSQSRGTHAMGVLPHIIGGGIVFVAVLWLLVRVLKLPTRDAGLMVLTVGLAIMVMVQVFLGVGVYMMMRFSQSAPHAPAGPIAAIVIATVMHVALGALIFAGSVAVTYMTYRLAARPSALGRAGSPMTLTTEPLR